LAQDHLGLFDTPADRREIRLGLLLVGMLCCALGVLLTLPDIRLREIDSFIPIVDSIMFLGDLITATLLYAQASIFRSRALTVLASGYVFTGLMLVAHVLTFPGAFAPAGLLGAKLNTTSWIGVFWRAGPPTAIILYVLIGRTEPASEPVTARPKPQIATGVLAAVLLAAVATLLTTVGHDMLPRLFVNRRDVYYPNQLRQNAVLITMFIVALVMVLRNRKSVLDLWLLVALSAWLTHALLNLMSWGRFTVSFYSQFSMLLFSHFVVMLALIAETNRLYARLAVSTSTRNREREIRLMSMDAVAAAISHEVGQPLSAVSINTLAGLEWLDRPRPNREKAMNAMRAAIDAGGRTFDVIKSIRATFAKGAGAATEFNLNDLVRETAKLLDRELAGHKVSLELALEENLPPILANKVQIQRLLINLFTNAIEAMDAMRHRPRRLVIRSMLLENREIQLEVSDTGPGIAPEKLPHIFEAFFTTKSTGTGLGLSLCRAITEEHGGLLWALEDNEYGATFCLQLPSHDNAERVDRIVF